MNSLSRPEKSKSELLVKLGAVLELFGVIVKCSIVAHGSNVGGLSELIAGEKVGKEEASELEAVLVCAEHVLVE